MEQFPGKTISHQLLKENYELAGFQPTLYAECCGWVELALNESNASGYCMFRGRFQEANAVNKNKRMYPYDVLAQNVVRLEEAMKSNSLYGELDHPSDSIIHLKEASHLVTKLWWEGNTLMGEGKILPTPAGLIARKIMEAGGRIGVSSRGVGNGTVNNEGVLVISEQYKLISFDLVADPSTYNAFQKRIVGTDKKESLAPSMIHTETYKQPQMDANALLSFVGCLLEQKKSSIRLRQH